MKFFFFDTLMNEFVEIKVSEDAYLYLYGTFGTGFEMLGQSGGRATRSRFVIRQLSSREF